MKRSHIEISDDEWDNLSFNPDRVLKPSNPPSPPPIESFAFRSSSEFQPVADVSSDDSLLAEVENFDGNLLQDLEDDDVEETTAVRLPSTGRGRKFVVDEDSDCEVVQVKEEGERRGGGGGDRGDGGGGGGCGWEGSAELCQDISRASEGVVRLGLNGL